jgi:hypothetical protein
MNPLNEIIIRIDPENSRVTLEEDREGVIARKEIDCKALYECIRRSIKTDGQFSGFLPQNCLSVYMSDKYTSAVIWHPRLRADITLHETVYPDFPLPRLVFGFHVSREGKVSDCRVCVIADETPAPETQLYKYPFSNVQNTGICTGANPLPAYKDLRKVVSLPDFILRIPNSFESYNPENTRLKTGYRELMEHLKDKDTGYYYSDVLIPEKTTLSEFIRRGYS